MKKSLLFAPLLFISYHNQVSSHDLSHQLDLQNNTCDHDTRLTLHTFNGQQIELWSNLDLDYSDIISREPPDTCSIYAKPDNTIDSLCGEVDHFMKAAQSAINFCKINSDKVPFFIGPQSFMEALNEPPVGDHHDNYSERENVTFICVEPCPSILL